MLLVILDKLIEDEETQVHGIVLCQDLEGLTFMKMMGLLRKEHFSRGILFELLQVSLDNDQTYTHTHTHTNANSLAAARRSRAPGGARMHVH